MPTTKDLIKATISGERSRLWVTDGHYEWMSRPEHARKHSPKAIEHVRKVFAGEYKHPREHRLSPSGIGHECPRVALFGFHGAPQLEPSIEEQDNMNIGTASHIWWQAEGLSQGYLDSCEDWFYDERLRMGGSTDGIGAGGVVDFKFCRGNVYDRIVTRNREPKFEHGVQWTAYKRLTGIETGSVVYIDRESGAFHEFPMMENEAWELALDQVLKASHHWIDIDALPRMLPDCERGVGYTFNNCRFREHCPAQPAHADAPAPEVRDKPKVGQNSGVAFVLPERLHHAS